jgi:monoamine oxidase
MPDSFSRRKFVVATAATAAGVALSACSGPTPGSSLGLPLDAGSAEGDARKTYDVIVIGAGPAGIGAARTVLSYGKSVLLLEAQDRPGGRAITDNTTFREIGVDLGAQFFGKVVAGNVLFTVAQARKLPVKDFITLPTHFYLGTKTAPLKDVASFVSTTGAMLGAILAEGALIAGPSQDFPASQISNAFRNDAYYQNAVGVDVSTTTGAEPPASSALDLYNFTQGTPSPFTTPGETYFIKSGMGNFIQSLANGLPVRLNTLVRRISRSPSGVTIDTNAGTFHGKAAIITVSTGVLRARSIEFKPALPTETQEAFDALPLGVVCKAFLGFKRDIFPSFKSMTAVTQLSKQPAITYFAKFWGTNVVEFLADADLAVKIEGMSRSGQIDYLLRRLEENVPGASDAFDGRISISNWSRNVFTHGSYSYAKVGMSEARETLRKSVANQLFFAGEATAQSSSITQLQGAYIAGIGAATGALAAIGVKVLRKNG